MDAGPKTVATKPPRPCPICGKPSLGRYYPFCSSRCKAIDLGRWLKGNYRFATEEGPPSEDGESEER
jgi:uncharacterized protein